LWSCRIRGFGGYEEICLQGKTVLFQCNSNSWMYKRVNLIPFIYSYLIKSATPLQESRKPCISNGTKICLAAPLNRGEQQVMTAEDKARIAVT
jgi:hypothetical protein